MTAFEYGTGIWAFGQFVDRYAGDGYGPSRSTEEMLDAAAQVQGLTYLDINVPFATDSLDAHDVKTMLDNRGLKCRATTPHIYMREYSRGAFTNPDSELRLRTRNRVEEAVEAAARLDASGGERCVRDAAQHPHGGAARVPCPRMCPRVG